LEVLSATVDKSGTNGCAPDQAFYTFIWHWSGSGPGTAQQMKFYEYAGDLPTNSDFNADVGSLPGAAHLGDTIIGNVNSGECEVCPTNFDAMVTNSFCATADSNKVYMVTDGIAASLPCPLSFTGFL